MTIRFEKDDGGRAASGRKGIAGDCVTRATSIAMAAQNGGRPADYYDDLYRQFAVLQEASGRGRSARNGVLKEHYESYFRSAGFVKEKLPSGPRPTWTEAHANYGDCIVTTRGHIAAIICGALRDVFDCRTYEWEDPITGRIETRERKAMSVWRLA